MPRFGFNGQLTEMKIFVLYIMREIMGSVTMDEMAEMVLIDDNMNFFLFRQSVHELAESGLLEKTKDSGGHDVFSLSPRGSNTLDPMERTLPISLRREGKRRVRLTLDRLWRETRIHTKVLSRGEEPIARMTLTDGRNPILHMELLCGSIGQAEQVCDYFSTNPHKVLDGVMLVLLGGK